MKIAAAIVALIALIVAGYVFIESDKSLLGQEYAMRVASDALGKNLYGSTCPRSQYLDDVQKLENRSSFVFGFRPKPSAGENCAFTKIIVDRKTGEIWVDVQKQ